MSALTPHEALSNLRDRLSDMRATANPDAQNLANDIDALAPLVTPPPDAVYQCGKCSHTVTGKAGEWPASGCPQCGSGAWTLNLARAAEGDWLARWMSGEQMGASTGIDDSPTYGYGELDAHGFFEVPVPAQFADALDRAYAERQDREGTVDRLERRVRELELRRGCECKCCDHGEGADCACDCHTTGRCAHVMTPNGPGTLMVGTKDGQVVVELPRDMTGHIVFSVQQAHDFAHLVTRKALEADLEKGVLATVVHDINAVCPACVLGNDPPAKVRLCVTHAAQAGPLLDPTNHHNALTCPYCNPHGAKLEDGPPPLWRHAVEECNQAHTALDRHGAPATSTVRTVRGPDGDQAVTAGLAARIDMLAQGIVDEVAPVTQPMIDYLKRRRGPTAPHAYVETQPYNGCGECGFGPGAAVHNVAGQPGMHTFSSGTKSSKVLPPFHLVPRAALRLIAERFRIGAEMRGEEWAHRKGVHDEAFFTDRVNHMIEHAFAYAEERDDTDLGAVMCNAAMLADILDLRRAR